jgi:uncharacterized protein (TIGR02284 family)
VDGSIASRAEAGDSLVLLLNELIELEYDAIAAYEQALSRLDGERHKPMLGLFMRTHQRRVRELGQRVRSLGGVPRGGWEVRRIVTRGRIEIGALAGDEAIFRAMSRNEDDAVTAYERAAKRLSGLGGDIRLLVERYLADERRHRSWIGRVFSRH